MPRPRARTFGSARLLAASFSFLLFSGLFGVVGALGACSDDDSTPAATENGGSGGASAKPIDLEEVVYESEATDEALESVLGVAAIVDDAKAPAFSEPSADGQALPASTPPTFAWGQLTASRTVVPSFGGSHLAFDKTLSLFAIKEASAHGEPNNGPVYFLEIAGETGDPVVRVFTTVTTYTPSTEVWAAIVAKGGTLSLKLVAARVENNELVAGGGPFTASKTRTFTIAN
jgi:hypothetical protein